MLYDSKVTWYSDNLEVEVQLLFNDKVKGCAAPDTRFKPYKMGTIVDTNFDDGKGTICLTRYRFKNTNPWAK